MAEGGTGVCSSKEVLNNGEDQRRTAGDGGISSKTVEVQGLSASTSQELVEMYFENSRRSGGGDIEEIQLKDGVAYITFVEAEIAQRVVSRSSHQVAGQTLTVTLYHPPLTKPCYDNRVLVQGLNSAVTEELLTKFLQTETGAKVTELLYGEEEGKVVVTFSNCIDFDAFRKTCKERRIEGIFLQVAKAVISNCILVYNLQPSTCQDAILLYFENKRRSGGGDVERVEMMPEEKYCLVYFEDNSVIDRVLSQTHKIEGADVEVHIHHECLGRRSSTRRSHLYLKMSNLEIKDIATLDNETTENPRNEPPSSISSDHDNESDFVEVPELQENDGNTQVLKLLIKYLKKQGKKNDVDVLKHLVSCSLNFQLMWNFYTQIECGRKMLDVTAGKYYCKVSLPVDYHLKGFFIFEVSDVHFQEESDVKHFVDVVLQNVYTSAQESLSTDSIGIDPRIQDDVREKLVEREELDCAWIELVGEENAVTVYTVCCKEHQQLVMQIITELITDAGKSFNSHKETVTADFMWQRVMTEFGYLKEIGPKFPSTEIIHDKNLNAFLLKGPRDEVRAVAVHLEELQKIAHNEIHEEVFSPGYQFEIFACSEMCDYIDNSLPKLPVVWIPNHLTKEIHLFSRDPKQLKGIDKSIKGCVEERLYPLSKDHSKSPYEIIHSLEEVKKKHKGKIVIHLSESSTSLLMTTADDIFKGVDAVVQNIIHREIGEVHLETCLPDKPYGRDGQPGCKPHFNATNPGMEIKDLFSEVTKLVEVKDNNLFRKLLIEDMEKFIQIAKEHCVSVETCEKESRVGFMIRGPKKGVQHIFDIISTKMQLQQDISGMAGAAEKVHKQMTPSLNSAGKSEDSDLSGGKTTPMKVTSVTYVKLPSNHLHGNKRDHEGQNETCPICLDTPVDPIAFKECGHLLCRECMEFTMKQKPVCPMCGKIYGITGNQPQGIMNVKTTSISLPGFNKCGTIDILYHFPSGIQTEKHPNPGKPYQGTRRRAYLPDNTEGRKVLGLLRKAFDRCLVFTIGRSVTTGAENTVTWNDIHHKTNRDGGPQNYGYPDPDYLRRVQEELAAKGVTEDT